MNRGQAIVSYISGIWKDDPVSGACGRVVEHIVSRHKQLSEMLSFRDIAKITGLPVDSPDLMQVVSVLTTTSILRWKFAYFPDEISEPVYLTDDEAKEFLRTHAVPSPGDGVDVPASADTVFPYFEADADLLKAEVE